MTDKQIIIDGVDVGGCQFLIIEKDKQMCRCIKSDLFGGIEFVENAKNGICKDNPDCYYKQLKCKEQECEELKDKLNCRFCYPIMKIDDPENFKLCQETECFRRQLDQLKAENKELKKEVQSLKLETGRVCE